MNSQPAFDTMLIWSLFHRWPMLKSGFQSEICWYDSKLKCHHHFPKCLGQSAYSKETTLERADFFAPQLWMFGKGGEKILIESFLYLLFFMLMSLPLQAKSKQISFYCSLFGRTLYALDDRERRGQAKFDSSLDHASFIYRLFRSQDFKQWKAMRA